MALNTALGFVIVAVSLYLLTIPRRFALIASQVGGLFLFLLSLLPLIGYAFGVETLYGFAHYTQMAIHTAVAFLFAGLGIMFVRPDAGVVAVITDSGPGGYLSRRLLPMTIATPVVLVWVWVMAERIGWHGLASDISLFFVMLIAIIVVIIWKTADSINQLDAKR